MRVLRRIRSLVSTHAPQPTPADGSAVVARTSKKSIFTRALQGAVVLGAGLALTVGAAVSPQVAWAASQEGTHGASLATSGANDWQIVSGQYQGNEATNKTVDTASDEQQYVRIQKNVVPTDRENEFKVYLSIDKKEDMRSFFEGSVFGTDNNMSSAPGSWSKINGQHEIYEEDPDVGDKPMYFEIDVVENREVLYTWTGIKYAPALPGDSKTYFVTTEAEAAKGNKGYCLILGQGTGGDSPDNPIHLTVDVDYEGFDDLFGTVAETAVSLESVTDPLGPCMNSDATKVKILASDGDASYSDGLITWNPEEKADSEAVNGWYENIAELVYSVELNVRSNDFESGGIPDGASADSNAIFAVNGTNDDPFATLEYSVTDFHISSSGSTAQTINDTAEFNNPTVRGLLYDLKLQKVDEEGKPLTGAKFKLMNTDGTKVVRDEAEVNENGYLEFSGLPHGNYVLVETQKPEGHDFPDDNPEGKIPVTLCYTTQAKEGVCCSSAEAEELNACDTHANNAVNENVVSVTNVRSTVDYVLQIYKVIEGRPWEDDDSFTFKIEGVGYYASPNDPVDSDYDMPLPTCEEGSANTEVTIGHTSQVAFDGARVSAFCPITFSEPGYYIYKITEVPGEGDSDLVYDDPWYVRIQISDTVAGGGLGETGMWISRDGKSWGVTRGVEARLMFVNRYVSLTFSGLQETKKVIGHDAAQGDFTFSVEADTEEAAELAGLSGLAESLTGAEYDSITHTLTFENSQGIDANSQTATTVRSANQLTLTAANVGKEYVYTYGEIADAESPWRQKQETVWRVTVDVDWVDPNTKNAIKADLKLEKSTDGEESWQQVGSQTYSSAEGAQNPTSPLTVSFVNEYGSTLEIVKTDQDDNPLAGAEFTVTGVDNSYSNGPVETVLNEDGKAAATFENIPDGTYTITETVPTGYQKINDMTLVIKDGTAQLHWKDTTEAVGSNGNVSKINGVFTITIENYVNPDLPSTGSSGTVLMSGLGTAAIVLAGAWLLKQRGIDLGKFTSR